MIREERFYPFGEILKLWMVDHQLLFMFFIFNLSHYHNILSRSVSQFKEEFCLMVITNWTLSNSYHIILAEVSEVKQWQEHSTENELTQSWKPDLLFRKSM